MSPRWDHPAPPTPPARSEANGAALRNWWGTVPKKVGHHYDRRPKSAPLPVETAPHLRRNRAPLPVGISAPFRPESAVASRTNVHPILEPLGRGKFPDGIRTGCRRVFPALPGRFSTGGRSRRVRPVQTRRSAISSPTSSDRRNAPASRARSRVSRSEFGRRSIIWRRSAMIISFSPCCVGPADAGYDSADARVAGGNAKPANWCA